ncbi:hypothetical protein BP5796_02084 [Coleophoma crateriformis]|uniref:Uncharacterized protein n=1 Tax=Coleophoma crateriformis TaxID=565419 RepID=A0A3D8SXC7_9HELO|nr:hypothetical protein BP5796_02084 [Coleophoma crateriformis]
MSENVLLIGNSSRRNLQTSYWSDLVQLDRSASMAKRNERSLEVRDDLDRERREMKSYSVKRKSPFSSPLQQPNVDDVSQPVVKATAQSSEVPAIGQQTDSRQTYLQENNELRDIKTSGPNSIMNCSIKDDHLPSNTSSDLEMLNICTSDQNVSDHEVGTNSMNHLSESMSTCTADQTDWDESSDGDSGCANESIRYQDDLASQAYRSPDRQILSAENILVDRLMTEFWIIFDQNWNCSIRHHATGTSTTSSSGSHAAASEQGSRISNNRKRARGKDPDDPNDRDERSGLVTTTLTGSRLSSLFVGRCPRFIRVEIC